MRTLCVIYLLTVLGIGLCGNILRAPKDPTGAVVAAILNMLMALAVLYLVNTPE